MSEKPVALAKLLWTEPETGLPQEYILKEGDSITIGRSQDNDVYIPERTVSRHHATVAYRSGVFTVVDMGSANGVFVNEEQIENVYPLIHGDQIRLFGPSLVFEAIPMEENAAFETNAPPTQPEKTSETPLPAGTGFETPYLSIASGDLMGQRIPLDRQQLTFGRAISNAAWDISLPDHAVSRPHAKIYYDNNAWFIEDLGSSNGTIVGGVIINTPYRLIDETIITMGETTIIFHEKPN